MGGACALSKRRNVAALRTASRSLPKSDATIYPMILKPKTAYLVASGDLRISANRVCWPEQEKMEAALGKTLAAEGWKIQRAHGFDRAKGHGFID